MGEVITLTSIALDVMICAPSDETGRCRVIPLDLST